MTNTTLALVPAPSNESFVRVSFDGDILAITEHEEKAYVGMKAISTALGLDWPSQYAKLKTDRILSTELTELSMSTDAGTRYGIFLPLRYLSGYLFKINIGKVAPALQDKIERYQRQCYDVLDAAFADAYRPQAPEAPSINLSDPLVMAQHLNQLSAQFIEVETKRQALEATVTVMQPKAELYDQVMAANSNFTIAEVAKTIGGYGRNQLFEALRRDKILIAAGASRNLPYQRYLNDGYFVTRTTVSHGQNNTQTLVTPKGLEYLAKKYGKPTTLTLPAAPSAAAI